MCFDQTGAKAWRWHSSETDLSFDNTGYGNEQEVEKISQGNFF